MNKNDDENYKHVFSLAGIVATALVWVSVWSIVDIAMARVSFRNRLLGYFICLAFGLWFLFHLTHPKSGIRVL